MYFYRNGVRLWGHTYRHAQIYHLSIYSRGSRCVAAFRYRYCSSFAAYIWSCLDMFAVDILNVIRTVALCQWSMNSSLTLTYCQGDSRCDAARG